MKTFLWVNVQYNVVIESNLWRCDITFLVVVIRQGGLLNRKEVVLFLVDDFRAFE